MRPWYRCASFIFTILILIGLPACMELGPLDERAVAERSTYRSIRLDPRDYSTARGEVVEERGETENKAQASASAPATAIAPAPTRQAGPQIPKPEEIPIDLPTVLRLAGTDSLEVRLADERLNEARARVLAADMQFLPSITPTFANAWHRGRLQDTAGNFLDVDKQNSLVASGAMLDLHLGEAVFASLASRRRVEANEAGVKATADESRVQAVNAFFNLVFARTEQAIVEDRLKQADETIRLDQELVNGGAALKSEVKRAEAARAEVRQRLAAAKEDARVASLNLTDVLHIDPLVTLAPLQQPEVMVNLIAPEKELTDLVSDAVLRRPELAESRAFWAALDKERRAAYLAPLIPTIRAGALNGGFGPHPSNLHGTAEYGAGLQWRIGFGGIGDVSRIRITEAQQKQESVRYAKVADQVVHDVVANRVRVDTTREQIALAKEEVDAAAEALRLSNERLKAGNALTLEVISAEEALFNAKSRAAQGIDEFNKAQYGLLRSIGGFREMDAIGLEKR